MTSRNRTVVAALGAVAAVACAASPARAAGVAYIEGHNVVVSAADGSRKTPLSSDGTAAAPYRAPVRLHDGRTVALKGLQYTIWAPDGTVQQTVTPQLNPTATVASNLAVDATGKYVAITHDAPTSSQTVLVGHLDGSAYPTSHHASRNAAFGTERVVGTHLNGEVFSSIKSYPDGPLDPRSAVWITPNPGIDFIEAVPDPTETKLFTTLYSEAAGDTVLGFFNGVPHVQPVTPLCQLRTGASPGAPAWSPDGALVAWSDAEGAKVAGAPTGADGEGWCTLASPPVLLSAAGAEPSLGGDLPALPGPPGPPGPPTGPSTPGAKAALAVKRAKLRAALKRGLKVTLTGVADGRVKLTAKLKRRVVARGKATAKGGTAKVTLRFTKAGKRKLRRVKKAKLVVAGGGAKATVTLKR